MRQAVVVDFDGTLVSRNSFEEFYKWLAAYCLFHGLVVFFGFLLMLIVLRKLRLISHSELKKRLLNHFQGLKSQIDLGPFIHKLKKWTNTNVVKLLKDYSRRGYVVVVSSAAPILYLNPYVRENISFVNLIIATPVKINDHWVENIGEVKKRRTLDALLKNNCLLSVFLTDHEDDLPLLLTPKEENILVKPSRMVLSLLDVCPCPCGITILLPNMKGIACPLPAPTREGYVFEGWYDGEKRVTEETKVEKRETHTLTARWRKL